MNRNSTNTNPIVINGVRTSYTQPASRTSYTSYNTGNRVVAGGQPSYARIVSPQSGIRTSTGLANYSSNSNYVSSSNIRYTSGTTSPSTL